MNLIFNFQFSIFIKNFKLKILNSFFSEKGFTLIEILVVMALIAILAASVWGNFMTSLSKGRDSKRKQDLDSISKALELYYTDFRLYPTAYPNTDGLNWGTLLSEDPDVNKVIYMQKMPDDPSAPGGHYCYISGGPDYKLYAQLENLSDSNILTPSATCNSRSYNFGLSSPNTTP